ncbi:ABC transporter substrate-binding protein [Actinomadura graeca]|uniref:Thiamine pyrimidine synthase n=1 Tax=Actinomadura graeca TaxID=2750812 RepID=A0ABX8QR45_9ACTN|nr:ABC transporter substrate-binding protein [Actinomadura graeca]QXJ21197.1 ABC transporter substrate-binding protein [Actinomadura graeca]
MTEQSKIIPGPAGAAPEGSAQSRRGFLKTVAAGSLLAGAGSLAAACGGGSTKAGPGSAKLKVALGWVTNIEFAGFWLAAERGYYRDEGLDVVFKGGGTNSPLPHVQLASGAADFAVDPNMRQVLEVIGKGNDLVMLGAQFQTDPNGLLSLAKRPLTKASELPGLRILSQQGTQPVIEGLYKANHLKPDFKFIPTGFDPGALVEGKGDAYNCFVTNQPITLETKFGLQRGSGYEVVTYGALGCPAYANMISCKRAMLTQKRDVAVKFMRASARGWQDNLADPNAAVKLVIQKYGVDLGLNEKQQSRENQLQTPLTESALTKSKGMLRIDPEVMKTQMYPWLRLAGAQQLPDLGKAVDTSVLDEVFKNGPRL